MFIVFVNCTLLQALCTRHTAHRWSRGMYSSTLSWPKALEGGEGSASRPGRFLPPGKTRYPLYRRLGGPQGRSGQVLASTGIRSLDRPAHSQSLYQLCYPAHASHRDGKLISVCTLHTCIQIWVKFGVKGLHIMLLSKNGFSENRSRKDYTLFMGINAITLSL